jgi:hypothetical protein
VHFPESETVPETGVHLRLRTALWSMIRLALGDRAMVGSDQFLYWDPTDPKRCLAPDVLVWVGAPDHPFSSWKVWERGAPHLCIEVVSESDARDRAWERKLGAYRQSGVRELVRFDGEDTELGLMLRLARDSAGRDRLLTDDEARRAEAEARRAEAEGRRAADARVQELEAELARRDRTQS